jgi:hypothetical protein
MEPVFTLPYSEFCVAQQLSRLFPSAKGYSLYAPFRASSPVWISCSLDAKAGELESHVFR